MKFSEFAYSRPNTDAICAAYDRMTAAAPSADINTLCSMISEHEKMCVEIQSMSSLAYVRHTMDTNDSFYNAEYDSFNESDPIISEKVKNFFDVLLTSPHRPELEEKFGKLLFLNKEIESKTISPEVIPLMQKENALVTRYQKLIASAQISFDGKIYTIPQIVGMKQNPDRTFRRRVYEAEAGFYTSVGDQLDEIYDDMVKLRTEIAHKLGLKSYTELGYLRMTRNCYTPEMVKTFRESVVSSIVPLACKMKEAQAKRLGLEKLAFYDDVCVFPDGNPAPKGSPEEMIDAGKRMYHELSPETGEFIDFMIEHELFDLLSKKGKAVGGYCTDIPCYKAPFIFSNFNGTSDDVEVLTHEAGHAFAAYLSMKRDSLLENIWPTLEGCEVHSMSMEFIAWKWLELFYGDDADRARKAHLESAVTFLPYGCLVDEFQHVVYDNPALTPSERKKVWLELESKYRPYVDFDGLPFYGDGAGWQRQTHIYQNPFYYIDYCFAQSVALEVWSRTQKDFNSAWKTYMAYTHLGGSKTFTELLAAAGLNDPFKKGCLDGVADTVREFIEK